MNCTFTVRPIGAALLLVRQSGEFVASTQRQLGRLGRLMMSLAAVCRRRRRRASKTLRARHRNLKLLQDLVFAVGGADAVVVVLVTVAVYWREINTGRHKGWQTGKAGRSKKEREERKSRRKENLNQADSQRTQRLVEINKTLTVCRRYNCIFLCCPTLTSV